MSRSDATPRVLLTGASGFLGRRIAAALRDAGVPFTTYGRGEADVIGDVTDAARLREAARGAEVVIHAAGLAHVFHPAPGDEARFHAVNADGTANAAAAAVAGGARRLIVVSSVSVYGPTAFADESAPLAPSGPYAESKAAGEQRVIETGRAAGIDVIVLRLATLYGEGDRGNIARLARQIAKRRFVWIGRGTNRKSLLHVDDAARAVVMAALAEGSRGVQIYNVSAEPHTMREVVDGLAAALGTHVPALHLPAGLLLFAARVARRRGLRDTIEKWMADNVYPSDRFTRDFGFRPQIGLEEGLRRQVSASSARAAAPGAR